VWGANDELLPSAYAARWGERVAGAQISMVAACGHSPHIEQCDLVTEKTFSFLDRVHA
jgi:pimeloyl-ACP methyl ester carboxylesterase